MPHRNPFTGQRTDVDLPYPEPAPEEGDRVKKIGLPQCAIVREIQGERVLIWWGTDSQGEVLEWVEAHVLEPFE